MHIRWPQKIEDKLNFPLFISVFSPLYLLMNVLSDGNLHQDNSIIIKWLKRCVIQSLWGVVKYDTVQNLLTHFIEVCRRKVENIFFAVIFRK